MSRLKNVEIAVPRKPSRQRVSRWTRFVNRFAFLRWPLTDLPACLSTKTSAACPDEQRPTSYMVRLLRYWWAGQALAAESRRRGRQLRVLDLGCEKGWLKRFTPAGVVAHWTGMDWNPRAEAVAEYDEVITANFDERLPAEARKFDAVVSLHVFEHLPRPGATAAEISRLLAEDGIFLGASPTMPEPFARWREASHRQAFAQGRIQPGGHINSMSPTRWRNLLYDVGLEAEFLTGSHAVRWTGSRLENWKWWIRLNQLWGALFPALGSECCVQARRLRQTHIEPVPLGGRYRIPRLVWGVAGAAAVAVAVLGLLTVADQGERQSRYVDRQIAEWVERKQDGNDRFYVWHAWIGPELGARDDVIRVDDPSDVPLYSIGSADTYLLLSQETSQRFLAYEVSRLFSVAAHLEVGDRDFYVLNIGLPNRTRLDEFIETIKVETGQPAS